MTTFYVLDFCSALCSCAKCPSRVSLTVCDTLSIPFILLICAI